MKARYPRPNKSAYEKSIDFLARRDHSEKELREKLADRQYTDEEIDEAITELWERRYLLPPEELSAKISRYLSQRGKGIIYIQQYLQKKGLPKVFIEPDLEIEKGLDLIERRLRCKPPFEFEMKVKVKRFLNNRGYAYESIQRIMNYE